VSPLGIRAGDHVQSGGGRDDKGAKGKRVRLQKKSVSRQQQESKRSEPSRPLVLKRAGRTLRKKRQEGLNPLAF